MADPDYEDLRDQEIAAFKALKNGVASYTMPGGRTVTYENKDEILDRILKLGQLIAQTTKGGATNYVSFVRQV